MNKQEQLTMLKLHQEIRDIKECLKTLSFIVGQFHELFAKHSHLVLSIEGFKNVPQPAKVQKKVAVKNGK